MVRDNAVEAPLKLMVSVCAWCGKELGRRWTTNGGVSHGICDDCRALIMKDREGKEGGDIGVQVSAVSGKGCDEVSLNQRGPSREARIVACGAEREKACDGKRTPRQSPQGCRLPLVIGENQLSYRLDGPGGRRCLFG